MSDYKIGEQYNYPGINQANNLFNPSRRVESQEENIWNSQNVEPVSFTSTPAMQSGESTVSNTNLFETLNAMGTGEHPPKEYNEYTGKRLDINA